MSRCQVSVSWVMSGLSAVFSPTLACHCILSRSLNLAQCPLNIFAEWGTLIRSVRDIRSGFEENLKCPISSFNVLSLCFVPAQWGRGNPFSLIVASFGFTFHSLLDPQQMFCASSWTVTRPGSSLTPHLEPQRLAWPSVTTSQVLWAGKFQSPWLRVQEIWSRLCVAAKRCTGSHASSSHG